MTIRGLKHIYRAGNRNTVKAPCFDVQEDTLRITEYLIGGTTCCQVYKKEGRRWVYDRTEC